MVMETVMTASHPMDENARIQDSSYFLRSVALLTRAFLVFLLVDITLVYRKFDAREIWK